MPNRSYRIGYNFQRRVVKYLEGQGFNTVVKPKSAFPDIIAWTTMKNAEGKHMLIDTVLNREGKSYLKKFAPFVVFAVECKVNKYLKKEEREEAVRLLNEHRVTSFLVAHRKGRKLLFYEINNDAEILDNAEPKGYIG